MNTMSFEHRADKAAMILRGIVHAIAFADQEAGDVQASSNWFSLIEAAGEHAFRILTDGDLGADEGGES